MRFKKNVSAELRAILREQLHQYKRENKDITEEEMKELEDWVAAGNSPYDNPYNGYREDGWPLDFISTIRDIEEENRWFESLSEEEKEELRHPKPSSTFEELDLDACLAEWFV